MVETISTWWRQDPEGFQLIVELPEDASFKRDVHIDLSRSRILLTVSGTEIVGGKLAHDVDADSSEWFVEDDLDDFVTGSGDDDARYLVMNLRKRESYLDWPSPLQQHEASSAMRRLVIGGKGDAQKAATAQQLASYQILQKLPSSIRGDVYARAPAGASGLPSPQLFFTGKVIAEAAEPAASLAAQVLLVKEHIRLYQPAVFSGATDDEIELWLAPGNSELAAAQNEISLTRYVEPSVEVELPSAGACGFEPETAPPAHMGESVGPLVVRRDAEGKPLAEEFKANVVKPDEVPGAFEKWLEEGAPVSDKFMDK